MESKRCELYRVNLRTCRHDNVGWKTHFVLPERWFARRDPLFRLRLGLPCCSDSMFRKRLLNGASTHPHCSWTTPNTPSKLSPDCEWRQLWANTAIMLPIVFWHQSYHPKSKPLRNVIWILLSRSHVLSHSDWPTPYRVLLNCFGSSDYLGVLSIMFIKLILGSHVPCPTKFKRLSVFSEKPTQWYSQLKIWQTMLFKLVRKFKNSWIYWSTLTHLRRTPVLSQFFNDNSTIGSV